MFVGCGSLLVVCRLLLLRFDRFFVFGVVPCCFSLFVVCGLLHVVVWFVVLRCLLFVVCCRLDDVRCLLFVACWLVSGGWSLMFVDCCLLVVVYVCCLLFVVC